MSAKCYAGVFTTEHDLLAATAAARQAGYSIRDVYTPYPVHGLDGAMGLPPSRLPWICFALAAAGFLGTLIVQYWIGAIDWPLNVGGKPFNSLPAYLPVMFELLVLSAGLGVVGALLLRTRLYPGKRAYLPVAGITDDRFVVAVDVRDASFDQANLERLWQQHGLVERHWIGEDDT